MLVSKVQHTGILYKVFPLRYSQYPAGTTPGYYSITDGTPVLYFTPLWLLVRTSQSPHQWCSLHSQRQNPAVQGNCVHTSRGFVWDEESENLLTQSGGVPTLGTSLFTGGGAEGAHPSTVRAEWTSWLRKTGYRQSQTPLLQVRFLPYFTVS